MFQKLKQELKEHKEKLQELEKLLKEKNEIIKEIKLTLEKSIIIG
jgi:hypothetical protein